MRRWPLGVTWIAFGTLGLFGLTLALAEGFGIRFEPWLGLNTENAFSTHPWQPLTFIWFHDFSRPGTIDLVINLLVVLGFGRRIEERYGKAGLLWVWTGSGIMGALGYGVISSLWGAAPAIWGARIPALAVLTLAACLEPRRPSFFELPLWLIAVVGLGFDFAVGILGEGGSPAYFGHLAGPIVAILFFKVAGWSPWNQAPSTLGPIEIPVEIIEARVDSLLEKIHIEGIENLSPQEVTFLNQASRVYQRKVGRPL